MKDKFLFLWQNSVILVILKSVYCLIIFGHRLECIKPESSRLQNIGVDSGLRLPDCDAGWRRTEAVSDCCLRRHKTVWSTKLLMSDSVSVAKGWSTRWTLPLLNIWLFTGRMTRSGKLPVLNLFIGQKIRFFRPAGRLFAPGLDWPLCHCAVFDEHRRPLAPSKFFDK